MKNFTVILKTMFAAFFLLQIIFYSQLYATGGIDVIRLDANVNKLEKMNHILLTGAVIEKRNDLTPPYIEETPYRIGEWSKTFTAVILMQMVDEKMIQLGTPLSRFFPDLPNGKYISMADLLSESLNITHYLSGGKYYHSIGSEFVFDELAEAEKEADTSHEFSFNNANYRVLAIVIEKISGKSYAEVLKERIIQKIELKNTHDGSEQNLAGQEVHTFASFYNQMEALGKWDLQSIAGSGSIISTPGDLFKFIHALFHQELVSEKSLMNILNLGPTSGLTELVYSGQVGFKPYN